MGFRCVGCNGVIPWSGKGLFSYTCGCGGHIFYDEETNGLAPPASLGIAIHEKKELPHLDYLVGESVFTSPLKERLIKELMSQGAIWMKDCEQCKKDGTLKRKQEREAYLAVKEAKNIISQSSVE